MTKATKVITDILTACGCNPGVTVGRNGNEKIKVNAPTAPANDPVPIGDFNDPWISFFEPD